MGEHFGRTFRTGQNFTIFGVPSTGKCARSTGASLKPCFDVVFINFETGSKLNKSIQPSLYIPTTLRYSPLFLVNENGIVEIITTDQSEAARVSGTGRTISADAILT